MCVLDGVSSLHDYFVIPFLTAASCPASMCTSLLPLHQALQLHDESRKEVTQILMELMHLDKVTASVHLQSRKAIFRLYSGSVQALFRLCYAIQASYSRALIYAGEFV